MLQSIIDDIRGQFRYGNKVMQIILINLFVFVGIVIIRAFSPSHTGFFDIFFEWIALPSGWLSLFQKPWTLFTHMFVHKGLWHFGWNMLMFYWFGKIVGDLIGDKKIVPLYISGGIFGAIFYLLYASLVNIVGIAFGASAAVMTFVVAAGFLAPDYNMRLILLGDVKLKYIAAVLFFLDFVSISEASNTGGAIAHIGGAIFGGLYIYLLQNGTDLLQFKSIQKSSTNPRRTNKSMKVVHSSKSKAISQPKKKSPDLQAEVDKILDKINESGYDSLSAEDKEILFQASKKK